MRVCRNRICIRNFIRICIRNLYTYTETEMLYTSMVEGPPVNQHLFVCTYTTFSIYAYGDFVIYYSKLDQKEKLGIAQVNAGGNAFILTTLHISRILFEMKSNNNDYLGFSYIFIHGNKLNVPGARRRYKYIDLFSSNCKGVCEQCVRKYWCALENGGNFHTIFHDDKFWLFNKIFFFNKKKTKKTTNYVLKIYVIGSNLPLLLERLPSDSHDRSSDRTACS